jgi:pimeloyl-ACP methyl ester carboxylesterase
MSVLRRLFAGFALLLCAAVLLGVLKSGGIPADIQVPDGASVQTAAMLQGVNCTEVVIPVKLSADGWFSFDVVGDLCRPQAPAGRVLQVLVSGSGYGSVYWDFPYEADTYSYVRAALRAGYSTFSFDRIGVGRSDHPLGALLNVDRQGEVLEQVIAYLVADQSPAAVVTVGHSFGSVTAIAHALAYPDSIAGMILTGFAHNTNPGFVMAMREGIDFAAFKGPFVGRLVDPTYVISKPDSRGDTFYTLKNADPRVIETDELNRQPTSIGEVISNAKYFGPQSRELRVPVLQLVGENDFVVCGGDLDCTDHAALIEHEAGYFGPAACLETVVIDDTDHNPNLHRNAPENFAMMLDWIARRVGDGPGAAATEPCEPV